MAAPQHSDMLTVSVSLTTFSLKAKLEAENQYTSLRQHLNHDLESDQKFPYLDCAPTKTELSHSRTERLLRMPALEVFD